MPSSAAADATKPIVHATANDRSFCDVGRALSIADHKTPASARQLLSYHCTSSRVIPESIEQHVRNFGSPAPLARAETTESRDYGKR